jgi:hypothetical protein
VALTVGIAVAVPVQVPHVIEDVAAVSRTAVAVPVHVPHVCDDVAV